MNRPFAPFTVMGACNRTVFDLGLETSLLPKLVTAQVALMDNLTFDKSGQIQEWIQTARCRLLYLPPYSPEFDKIEQRRVLAKKSNS
ncbi:MULTISPECIES: transposase [unclassified Microcoleus]|uniref:transposase n=1 Tax=unclassified Microcoleus TaxID=2642155 RepID=UPI00403F3EB3